MFNTVNITLKVSSLERSINFYTRTLGFPIKSRSSINRAEILGPGLVIALYQSSGNNDNQSPPSVKSGCSIGLEAANLKNAIQKLEEKGVEFSSEPGEEQGMHSAVFKDPDGNLLYLFETAGPIEPAGTNFRSTGPDTKNSKQSNWEPNLGEEEEDLVLHEGEPLAAREDNGDGYRHMGALDENMTTIAAPVVGRLNSLNPDEDDSHKNMQVEDMTPG